jgi:hypothetical protein
MTQAIGSYAAGPFQLSHFNETPVLNLRWFGGNGLVFGRVQFANGDGDTQKFQAWLTHGYPRNTIDYVEFQAQAGRRGFIPLSGWNYNMPAGEIIEILCATYDGYAFNPRLTALLVEQLHGEPPRHAQDAAKA